MLDYIAAHNTQVAGEQMRNKGYSCEDTPDSVLNALQTAAEREGLRGFSRLLDLHPDRELFELREREKRKQRSLLHAPWQEFELRHVLLILVALTFSHALFQHLLNHEP